MKKIFIYIFILTFSFNYSLSQEYLDAYTLDKKKIETNVMESVSDEKIKFKSIKIGLEVLKIIRLPNLVSLFSAKKLENERNNNSKVFYKNCFFTMLPNLQPTLVKRTFMETWR